MDRMSKGRQKVETVKTQKESNLQVTFSKTRSGLYKKASELYALGGVEMTIIFFLLGKKAFSFGHHDIATIIDCCISRNPPLPSPTKRLIEAHRNLTIHELNMQVTCNFIIFMYMNFNN